MIDAVLCIRYSLNMAATTKTTTAKTCPRCGGSGQTPFRWILGGICFRCEGLGRIDAAARKASKLQQAIELLDGAVADVEDWTAALGCAKQRAIKRADSLVAKGKAPTRAAALETMAAQGKRCIEVAKVEAARECLAGAKDRAAKYAAALERLQK